MPTYEYYPESRYRRKILRIARLTHRAIEQDYTGLPPKLEQIIRALEFTQIELPVYCDRAMHKALVSGNPRNVVAHWPVASWSRRYWA
jgi:hypothetical protein